MGRAAELSDDRAGKPPLSNTSSVIFRYRTGARVEADRQRITDTPELEHAATALALARWPATRPRSFENIWPAAKNNDEFLVTFSRIPPVPDETPDGDALPIATPDRAQVHEGEIK